ncbi:alpha/beta fold hydrolase [Kribbella qitaiheensis]|uniref:alpha/beta fold hydrolase n=1 Tax=Kribbella qitaiheensis TaxID=1544730 RepID=UPI0019D5BBD4|nr:alpha/beta hydrolase [Kribbella qitaiheensis]
MTAELFLVHGGLWEAMDAAGFWRTPRIVAGLEAAGMTVIAPDRPRRALSWSQEVDELGGLLPSRPVMLVGASNGCSVAARLALTYPAAVCQLLLAWPGTGGDSSVDERTRAGPGRARCFRGCGRRAARGGDVAWSC